VPAFLAFWSAGLRYLAVCEHDFGALQQNNGAQRTAFVFGWMHLKGKASAGWRDVSVF
jgi:hypothetical protein